jgi:hypothetical protein
MNKLMYRLDAGEFMGINRRGSFSATDLQMVKRHLDVCDFS